MAYKKLKKIKKKEDLPSFLLQSPEVPENVSFPPKTTKSEHHLGPIFFGCHEYQPMFHRLNLGLSHELHKTASSTENILRDAFITPPIKEKYAEVKKKVYPPAKPKVLFSDPYLHKCPGERKIFAPEPPSVTDLGETESTIQGEASREIPVYCFKKNLDGSFDGEYELVELSEIWEKKRIFMSDKERMAHTHFPKEFVTLKVIGPTIPAAITITKLPSKRKTESQLDLELNGMSKTKKGEKESSIMTEKMSEAEGESVSVPPDISTTEENVEETVKAPSMVKTESEIREGNEEQEVHSDKNEVDELGAEEDAEEGAEGGAVEGAEEYAEDAEIIDGDVINVPENEATEEVPVEEKTEE